MAEKLLKWLTGPAEKTPRVRFVLPSAPAHHGENRKTKFDPVIYSPRSFKRHQEVITTLSIALELIRDRWQGFSLSGSQVAEYISKGPESILCGCVFWVCTALGAARRLRKRKIQNSHRSKVRLPKCPLFVFFGCTMGFCSKRGWKAKKAHTCGIEPRSSTIFSLDRGKRPKHTRREKHIT